MTEKLYYKNPYLKECKVKIVDIIDKNSYLLIIFDKTIFSPSGGGESCDQGFIDKFKVIDIFEEKGIIYHKINKIETNKMTIGNDIIIKIDFNNRFKNMQRHCAEHILAGVFHNRWQGENMGFHMGLDYMTIDIKFPKELEIEDVTKIAEFKANQIVWDNIEISAQYYNNISDMKHLNLRKDPTVTKDIRVIRIGNHDAVSCCGSHPKRTGEVGLIKIYKTEKRGDFYRFYFDSGENAIKRMSDDMDTLRDINLKLSTKTKNIIEKINLKENEIANYKTQLSDLKKNVLIERLNKLIDSNQRIVFSEEILSHKDLIRLSNLIEQYNKDIIIIFNQTNSILICSKNNKMYLEKIQDLKFKGGGKKILSLQFNNTREFKVAIKKLTI